MNEVLDFLMSAFPWIAIGLFVACSCVTVQAKKTGKEMSKLFKGLCWTPIICFLFVAVWEMYSGNTSSGATWLVLGVCSAVLNFANIQNSENEKEENKEK